MFDSNLPTAKYQEQIYWSSIQQMHEEFLTTAEIACFDTRDLSSFNEYKTCVQIHSYRFLYWTPDRQYHHTLTRLVTRDLLHRIRAHLGSPLMALAQKLDPG